jgi:hypothetical protein
MLLIYSNGCDAKVFFRFFSPRGCQQTKAFSAYAAFCVKQDVWPKNCLRFFAFKLMAECQNYICLIGNTNMVYN